MGASPQEEALQLSRSLLDSIDQRAIDALGAVRTGLRIARLVDDADAATWLLAEIRGYPSPDGRYIDTDLRSWAYLAGRVVDPAETSPDAPLWQQGRPARVIPTSLSRLELIVDATSHLKPADVNADTRPVFQTALNAKRIQVEVLTAVHLWAGKHYHRLQFGSAVDTAFAVVRSEVDSAIARLVPGATEKLSAAFANAASNNPEHWAGAAATCRRLLKATADALRPPGPDVGGRKMGEEHYVNRLVDWISGQAASATLSELIRSELEYLGRRLDATVAVGAKGAHSEVGRFDASRYVTGTYLLLGDVLRLQGDS